MAWTGDLRRRLAVARGDEQADLVVRGGRVLSVFTREWLDVDVAICDGVIAGLGEYEGAETLDAEGAFVVPGFIDAHMHLESVKLLVDEFARLVLPLGTTAVVADPHEIGNVLGTDGIHWLLDASSELQLEVYFMAPSCVPASPFESPRRRLGPGDLENRGVPSHYRVHERPDPSAVEFMIEQLVSLDVPTPPVPKNMSPQQAAQLAGEASRMAAEHSRRTGRGRRSFGSLVLRSLKQAYYTPKNLGHAGLASPHYCHFTSPIRRYPDIVAHRALLQGLGIDQVAAPRHELEDAGVHCSAVEREAMKIERGADDVCSAFLLERVISEMDPSEPPKFEGEVVGTIDKGAFVTFGDEGFEGMLPVRRLPGWWTLNEVNTALVEEKSGRTLRLGDPVEVVVDRVDAPRGRVDLLPAGSY